MAHSNRLSSTKYSITFQNIIHFLYFIVILLLLVIIPFNLNVDNNSFIYLTFRTLISALHVWLDSYPDDFKESPNHLTLTQLLQFCKEHLPGTELEAKAKHRLEKYGREPRVDSLLSGAQVTGPLALRQTSVMAGWRSYHLPDVPVKHFAEQLTRMDVVSILLK